MSIFNVSIITLTKNDPEGLIRTAFSISQSHFEGQIEWLVLDGSKGLQQLKNKNFLSNLKIKHNIYLSHLNLNEKLIFGIYNSMDYGLEIAKGQSLLFMNGGDEFFDNNSLNKLYKGLAELSEKKSFAFGQALIYKNKNCNWKFPDQNINNINKWLHFFEPNHQTMLVNTEYAKSFKFKNYGNLYADEYWKRRIINNSLKYFYLGEVTCKFNLEGISNKKLTKKQVFEEINSTYTSPARKLIIIFKFLIPNFIFKFYPFIMKFKNKIIGLIF